MMRQVRTLPFSLLAWALAAPVLADVPAYDPAPAGQGPNWLLWGGVAAAALAVIVGIAAWLRRRK